MLLIFWLLCRLINQRVAHLTVVFYSICPWMAYVEVANSLYSAILFSVLMLLSSLVLYRHSRRYSLSIIILISLSFLLFLISKNPIKIDLFDDPGLLNFVNMFQGELKESGTYTFGRFIENRYVFGALHIFFSVLKQFSPATYFSSQEKLLGFSFSPPIYFGLLIPFIFGLPAIFDYIRKYRYLLILGVLLIPSILSKNLDLARLSLISPFIFLTIGLGYQKLLLFKYNSVYKFLIFISISLVLFQFVEVIIDIPTLEPMRMMRLTK